jgi:hypothetical protein
MNRSRLLPRPRRSALEFAALCLAAASQPLVLPIARGVVGSNLVVAQVTTSLLALAGCLVVLRLPWRLLRARLAPRPRAPSLEPSPVPVRSGPAL